MTAKVTDCKNSKTSDPSRLLPIAKINLKRSDNMLLYQILTETMQGNK